MGARSVAAIVIQSTIEILVGGDLILLGLVLRQVAFVLLQCLFDRFGSVFPQCGLMVFPGVVIVSR